MLLEFNKTIDLIRKSPVDGTETIIYTNIKADIQDINRWQYGDNSLQSEKTNLLVYIEEDKRNIKIGDLIKYENDFGEQIVAQVIEKSLIDFQYYNKYIEIKALKL